MSNIVYWTPESIVESNTKDVEVPKGSGRYMRIRAIDPEEFIEFSAGLRAVKDLSDEDPEKQRASFNQMRAAVKKALMSPSPTDELLATPGFGRLLLPLFQEIMAFSGLANGEAAKDDAFRA